MPTTPSQRDPKPLSLPTIRRGPAEQAAKGGIQILVGNNRLTGADAFQPQQPRRVDRGLGGARPRLDQAVCRELVDHRNSHVHSDEVGDRIWPCNYSLSRLFWAISSKSRAFSRAIADWSAKLCIRLTMVGEKSPGCRRWRTSAPRALSALNKGTMTAKPNCDGSVAQGVARPGEDIRNLQRRAVGKRLTQAGLSGSNVEFAVSSCILAEVEWSPRGMTA